MRLLMCALLAIGAAVSAATQPAPPPATDIYELSFSGGLDSLRRSTARAVATQRGYDNQPQYTPDGAAILFTANRDGKQTDIFQFDRATGRTRQVTATPEGEYSPTITPDGQGISVIRVEADGTQRLWRFARDGSSPRLVLTEIKPVGYHAWIDADRLALFVLGQPATLQLASVASGKAVVVASDIGRSLQRIPNSSAVSFVHRETEKQFVVKRVDPETRAITAIAAAPAGSGDRDTAWLPDGTLLMSAGTRILAWPAGGSAWREVFDAASVPALGPVSRMAASPDGQALAIVVGERK